MKSSYDIVSSLRRTRDDLDEQQKSAMDLSPKLNEDTDRRDCRQTRQHRRHNLNHHQNYNNLTSYERSNVLGSSTSQATMQNTESRDKSSSRSRKRLQIFTIQEKIDAINRVHDGECKAGVARDINVPESTLRGWCKFEEKIRSQLNMIASENDEHIPTTSNSGNNDNNPAINTVSMSNISALYEPFLRDQLLRSYFYNQLANDTVMKGSLDLYNSSLSVSGQSSLAASFPNDGPYMHRSNDLNADVTMANMTPTSNALVNANSAPIHTEDSTILNIPSSYAERTFESIPQISNRRLSNSLSSEFSDPSGSIPQLTNSRTSSVPSTSRNNGDVVTTISSKLSKPRKRLSTAICQQQQGFLSPIPAYDTREEDMSNNAAISNNNNNVDYVDNEISRVGYYPTLEISNRRLSNSLSPESSDPSGSIPQLTSSRTSPVPSTSRNNGDVVTTISSKLSKPRKRLSTAICQQQQGFLSPIPAYDTREEDMSNNAAISNNNNNVDYVDNEISRVGYYPTLEISNRRLSNSLSPESSDPSGSIPQLTSSRTSPVPSTSRNNGDVVTTISSKLSKPRKRLSTAICQQQQGFLSPIPAYDTREEDMSNNAAISNNNNNVDYVDNEISRVGYYPTLEISNRRLSNSLSPESSDPSGSIPQLTSSRTSPVPSTSRNNGEVVTTISSKSSKNRKKLSTIVCQLQQGFLPPIPAYGTGEEDMSNSNNNNNDVDYVDNEMSNRNSSSLPPNFSEILSCCIKVLEWLENYGSAVCTFRQAAQMRTVLDNLIHFANSKENEARDRANDRI